jgi:phenylalanyl-tRNA synthetase beta chain
MLFSLSWLKQHLETTASVTEIAERLVTLGVEVESVEDESAKFDGVVVGHVLKRVQHPDADKLGVCTVDVGAKEPLQIVCGAPNARDGIKVAVILMGAKLPNGMEITKAKMRGVESCGMICSARELGLGNDHTGIMELETDKPLGTPFAETLGDLDVIFDVSITPNRGDVLSVYGIARDLAASGLGKLKPLEKVKDGSGKVATAMKINSKNCSFFSGISINGIKNTESPAWLKNKLEQVGLRPRNAVVDITNYILVGLGQPLHSYDADKLKGTVTVEDAKGGEKYTGIGDVECVLNKGDMTICDDSGVIGLAGILGGETTAVEEKTTNVYLEAAVFDRSRITQTGQAHQINSDARYRFERGVDPAMTEYASKRAASLIVEICGGKISEMDTAGSTEKVQKAITLNPEKLETFGGLSVKKAEIKGILEALGFTVIEKKEAFSVTPPSFRTYMETEEDLIEEVLRVKNYDSVPAVLPPLSEKVGHAVSTLRGLEWTARYFLSSLGYLETINYSFISENNAKTFAQGEKLVKLANPIDEATMSTMRPSLIPGLLDAAAKNIARSVKDVRFGEVGQVFTENNEQTHVAVIRTGTEEKSWQGNDERDVLFAVKGDLHAMIGALGLSADIFQISQSGADYYHPGRSGTLKLGKNTVAYFGELHPATLKKLDIKGKTYGFELNLSALEQLKTKVKSFETSNYQPVEKDMAFIVEDTVSAGEMLNTIKKADKGLVKHVDLFDVYQGENLPKGKKSFAFSVMMQAADRTLKDEEIKAVMDKVASLAIKHHKAELRDG